MATVSGTGDAAGVGSEGRIEVRVLGLLEQYMSVDNVKIAAENCVCAVAAQTVTTSPVFSAFLAHGWRWCEDGRIV